MKKYRLICLIVFCLLMVKIASNVLEFKFDDGNNSTKAFYELDNNTVDILALGSSHAFANINPQVFWDSYGYAAYDLGSSFQMIWNTYYYLVEALKTQNPSVIILDAYQINCPLEYYEDSSVIIKSTAGLKWSKNKIEALFSSTDISNVPSYLLEYSQYHSRYEELTPADFLKYNAQENVYKNWKGFRCNYGTTPFPDPVADVEDVVELPQKTELYYRKIIELAQSKNIPIIVVVSPYCVSEEEEKGFNKAAEIAQEYGVDFLDFNKFYQELGIDYSTDFNDVGHLNYRGTIKYTNYLSEYIHLHYQIEDKRNNEKYTSWEENAKYLKMTYIEQELIETVDERSYIDVLNKLEVNNYTIIVRGQMRDMPDYMYRINDTLFSNRLLTVWDNDNYYCDLGTNTLKIDCSDSVTSLYYNRNNINKAESGVTYFVYNNYSEKLVDIVGFDYTGQDVQCIR